MGKNGAIVTCYMQAPEFQAIAFPMLAKAIFEAARGKQESSEAAPDDRS
jgi:hypothetical protein